ncbi:MAG: oligosaccharide flippase family protein, partial [Candidatus Woesearchaeota archaeon]
MIKKEINHLISFLNKWTELDVMYYVRGGALLFSTQFLIVFCSFLLSVAFAYWTSKEFYGQFQFVLAVLGTISVLSFPGANNAVLVGVSENKDGTLLQGMRFKLKWSILGVLALLIAAGYFYFEKPSEPLWQIFLLSIIFFPILTSLDVTHAFFFGKKKPKWSCVFQLFVEAGSSIGALVALYLSKNLLLIVAVYLIIQSIGDIWSFVFARRKMENGVKDADFVSYSAHLTVINFIPYIKVFFDKLIVTFFLGFAATAVYTIAAALSEQLYSISKNVSLLVFPKLTAGKKEVIYKYVIRHIPKLIVFFVVIAGVASIFAPIIIPFFFSEQYSDAVLLAQLLLVVSIPRAIGFVLSRV